MMTSQNLDACVGYYQLSNLITISIIFTQWQRIYSKSWLVQKDVIKSRVLNFRDLVNSQDLLMLDYLKLITI